MKRLGTNRIVFDDEFVCFCRKIQATTNSGRSLQLLIRTNEAVIEVRGKNEWKDIFNINNNL